MEPSASRVTPGIFNFDRTYSIWFVGQARPGRNHRPQRYVGLDIRERRNTVPAHHGAMEVNVGLGWAPERGVCPTWR